MITIHDTRSLSDLVIRYVSSLGHNLHSLFNEYINNSEGVAGREPYVMVPPVPFVTVPPFWSICRTGGSIFFTFKQVVTSFLVHLSYTVDSVWPSFTSLSSFVRP